MKLDILIFSAHPDDAELGCGGTIFKQAQLGHKIGIVDITLGELGTRGTPEIRAQEAKHASQLMNLAARENLKLRDGFFGESEDECLEVIKYIRYFQPEIIICNAPQDRHPDHGMGYQLIKKAGFLSGLRKINTSFGGITQSPWRAKHAYSYIQDQYLLPDFVIDVSSFWDNKMMAIKAYKTQFWNPESNEPSSYISSAEFLEFIEARGKELGHSIGVKYGEGFIKHKQIAINELFDLK